MDAAEVTLANVSKGAIAEVFAKHVAKVAANLGDINTTKDARKITLTFSFTPFPDRSGVECEVKCTSKLGELDTSSLTTTLFLAKREGQFTLFSRDLRQELLFTENEPPPFDQKQQASGEQP